MYEHLEQLNDRKSEKFVLFLTLENLGGMLALAGPVYVISTTWPLLVRFLALALAIVLGVGMTFDWEGLPLYRRGLCRMQGVLWRLTQGRPLLPASLPRSSDQTARPTATLVLPRRRMVTRLPGHTTMQRRPVLHVLPSVVAFGQDDSLLADV